MTPLVMVMLIGQLLQEMRETTGGTMHTYLKKIKCFKNPKLDRNMNVTEWAVDYNLINVIVDENGDDDDDYDDDEKDDNHKEEGGGWQG